MNRLIDRPDVRSPEPKNDVRKWPLAVIAFMLSGVMLAYEILLTRIASVVLTSQYIFLIVGLSLLGISVGAIIEYVLARRNIISGRQQTSIDVIPVSALLVLAVLVVLRVGADQGANIIGLAAALPFGASGFAFARLFRVGVQWAGTLYAADLAGAAMGALSVPLLLPALGPVQATFLLASVLTAVGTLFSVRFGLVRIAVGSTTVVGIALLFFFNEANRLLGEIPVGKNPDKDLYRLTAMQGGSAETVESRWSTFGRTDLVRVKGDSSTMAIFVDGAAGTNMVRFDGSFADSSATFTHAVHQFGGLMPLLNLADDRKNSALVIGPGGGRDVLIALKAGFKNITAVDINPQMVAIVKDYSAFNGGIYTSFKNVNVVVAEGRNYLRHSDRTYDLITLFMPITKSSQSLNSFALSESSLFTKEAFKDYYDRLTDNGSLLVMAHSMPEAAKLLTTTLGALLEDGMSTDRAMKHTYILGSEMMPLFGLSKAVIDSGQSAFLHQVAHYTMFDCGLSFIPGIEELVRPPLATSIDAGVPMMNPIFINLAEGKIPVQTVEYETGLNLVPATDDRPFFFQYDFALPQVLFSILWLSLGFLGVLFFVPARWFEVRLYAEGRPFSYWLPLFVVAIGVGYIVVELSLFQRLVFYLGDPSKTFALLLAALLAGGGTGSFLTRRAGPTAAVVGGCIAGVFAIVAHALLPVLFSLIHSSGSGIQQALAAAVVFMQGIPMGIMFPIALRLGVQQFGDAAVPWMWAINGSASVAGSALAIIIAMASGYSWSLVFGAVWYGGAALCMAVFAKQHRPALHSSEESEKI